MSQQLMVCCADGVTLTRLTELKLNVCSGFIRAQLKFEKQLQLK